MSAYRLVLGIAALILVGLAWIAPRQGTASPPVVPECPADLAGDGVVDAGDLLEAVLGWGPCAGCRADLNGDGAVDAGDLLQIVVSLGGCAAPDAPIALPVEGMHICAVEDDAFATADGGCKDLVTGLVWSTHNMGNGSNWLFEDSEQFISESTEGGFTDWRFPTVEEMETVAAHGASTHFSGFVYCHNWSSERQGQYNYATNVFTGDTVLLRAKGAGGGDHACFVGVREAGAPSTCNSNDICEPGEDCENCAADCEGKTNGPPSGRFCCGDGILQGPEGDGTICDGNP
jgi:hypothetical protein